MIGETIDHYRITAELGSGGMGVVYRAEDTRLGRTVALKFLPPHLTHDRAAKARFLAEARTASAIDHPNLCTIHDVGEAADGRMFLAMACYEGETLRDRLARGPLAATEPLEIAHQVARGLAAAHAHKIVHRDVKPANVFLCVDGQVKLLDFGIAILAEETRLTRPDQLVGTVQYMSPEQARGEEVDARTDIWSLGAVLYEMLRGEEAFARGNAAAVVRAILDEEPEALAAVRPELPDSAAAIVMRCLAKDPDSRWRDAGALADALSDALGDRAAPGRVRRPRHTITLLRRRWRAVAGAVVVIVIAAVTFGVLTSSPAARIEGIAVLPFADLSAEVEHEVFADGMTEALITELQMIASDRLRVIGRTSVMAFKHSDAMLPDIARQLDVDAVVEASVVRSGDLVRIAAKLIRARPVEQQIWAATYQRNCRDVLALHAEVAREVAAAIEVALAPDVRAADGRSVDPEAYETYLAGRHQYLDTDLSAINRRDPDAVARFMRTEQYFRRSIAKDSTFAPAWVGLADFYTQCDHVGLGEDPRDQALRTAERALELDETLGEAHTAMAHILFEHQFRPREAGAYMRRALELNPNASYTHAVNAYYCLTMGRYDESAGSMLRALELDPLSRFLNTVAFQPIMFAGRHDDACRVIEQARARFPDCDQLLFQLAEVHRHAGAPERGLDVLDGIPEPERDVPFHATRLRLLAELGRMDEARACFEDYRSLAETDSVFGRLISSHIRLGDLDAARNWFAAAERSGWPEAHPWRAAYLAMRLDDLDRAFALLELAYDERFWFLVRLATFVDQYPDWRGFAGDPRLDRLVQRLGVRG